MKMNRKYLGSIKIHGVDGVVRRIGPVDLLMGPVVSNSFRIDSTLADECDVIHLGRIGVKPSDASIRPDLGEYQPLVTEVEIESNDVR